MYDPRTPSYFLNPNHHPLAGDPTPLINPATLETAGMYADPQPAVMDEVLDKVRAAQKGWAALDAKTRAKHLHEVADAIEKTDMRPVARLMTLESGKPYPEAIGEIANIPAAFRYYAEMARDDAGKVAGNMQPGSFQFQTYAPYGVSVHVVPYNFPLILGCWTMAASLAAGNGVVLKAAPAGTLCAMAFMQVFRALPENLVACLPGGPDVGRHLIGSDRTDVVAFTGSVPTARKVAAEAARQMKPVVIEAGGSDPMIVSRNADVPVAAAGAVTSAFLQSGQVCTSTERIYVDDAVHDEFVEAFIAQARKLRIGNGLDVAEIGPLVSEDARDRVMTWVKTALDKGATLALGGGTPPDHPVGWFFEPTIMTGVTPEMGLFEQEIFGPVAAVLRVGSFDEALDLANQSEFGLGASVFTRDLAEAHGAIDRLQAGMVWVNNPLVDNDALPFGGMKNSGIGRSLGREGLNAFRQPKMAVIDPVARMADWWYPYPDDWFYSEDGDGGRQHS